ncbi:MAG: pyridoxamine 5'-phosphate oxidase family protein [Defluviitaleaceae bacterium]|nr:pyridoxamine 5'-phosphate oxidase family protein [Defluviitaleaceae bacterium]
MNNREKVIARANDVANKHKGNYATIALMLENGYPTASTITITNADGIKALYFAGDINQNKARRATANNRASICISSADYNITLVGTVEVITDPKIKAENWLDAWSQYWTNSDHPDFCAFRFKTETFNICFMDGDYLEDNGIL